MMNFRQSDPRWGNMGIGTPMRTYGCFVTSLSMLCGKTPDNVLNMLMQNNCFDDNGDLIDKKAAMTLGFKTYGGFPAGTPTEIPVIAETHDNTDEGFPSHLFILMPDGTIVDPLTGVPSANKYTVANIRVFA